MSAPSISTAVHYTKVDNRLTALPTWLSKEGFYSRKIFKFYHVFRCRMSVLSKSIAVHYTKVENRLAALPIWLKKEKNSNHKCKLYSVHSLSLGSLSFLSLTVLSLGFLSLLSLTVSECRMSVPSISTAVHYTKVENRLTALPTW